MSDEEDYLSDKFLVEVATSSSQPQTYAQRRQEALKQSRIKNEQNRSKSRRQREQESREEGLRKSLFDRVQEGSQRQENKALGIMLKMDFKIGQSLGQERSTAGTPPPASPGNDECTEQRDIPSDPTHKAEPLALNEWSGRKGIGLVKRARSPAASDRLAKMAKMAEDASKENFRDFARREFEERRAESRLTAAQRTCATLDEMAGITFNVLWVNPGDADSVPEGLMDALLEQTHGIARRGSEATRLRDQMRADALQPVANTGDDHEVYDHNETDVATPHRDFPAETVQEAACFFRLGPRDRLSVVLGYLRDKHAYCFWCGTKYEDDSDLEKHCPGPTEEDHD